jgi:phosphoribosylformylglycinamidine cyclo-ligase
MKLGVDAPFPEAGRTVAEVLLAVHRSYAAALRPVLGRVHGLAHITGGGIAGNLVRVLPEGVEAVVEAGAWEWPAPYRVMQAAGGVSTDEMREVFNLGVGMIAAVPPGEVEAVRAAASAAGVPTWVMGEVRPGARVVRFAE